MDHFSFNSDDKTVTQAPHARALLMMPPKRSATLSANI